MKTSSRPTHGDGQTATCHLEPVRCDACGAEIEVGCPNGCEGRKRANWQRAFEQLRDSVMHHFGALPGDFEQIVAGVHTDAPVVARPLRQYQGKPATMLVADEAPAKAPARKHGTIDNRIYQPKPCKRCGNLFQPTGPRSLYCGACP